MMSTDQFLKWYCFVIFHLYVFYILFTNQNYELNFIKWYCDLIKKCFYGIEIIVNEYPYNIIKCLIASRGMWITINKYSLNQYEFYIHLIIYFTFILIFHIIELVIKFTIKKISNRLMQYVHNQ